MTEKVLGGACPVPSVAVPNTATCSDSIAMCERVNNNDYRCLCPSSHYDDNGVNVVGGSCKAKKVLGGACPVPSVAVPNTATCSDSIAMCERVNNNDYRCLCPSSHYDDNGVNVVGGSCKEKIELGATCPTPTNGVPATATCKDSIATCKLMNGYECLCPNTHYDDNGDNTIGGSCQKKRNLGEQCTETRQCSDGNSVCETTTCQCHDGYYQTSGTNIKCDSIINLRVANVGFPSIQTNQMTVRWTAPDTQYKQYISGYTMQWKPKHDNSIAAKSADLDVSPTMFLLKEGIEAGRAYTITIVSNTNQTFQGPTRKTSVMSEQAAKPNITSGIDLTNSESDASDGSMKIAWYAPSGYVSGYIVNLLDGTTSIGQSTSSVAQATFVLTLKNGYRYTVTIQAESETYDNGKTVSGEIFTGEFKTTPKKPNPPENRICKDPTDSAITVSWTAPALPNGDIERYSISVYSDNRTNLFNETTSGSQTQKKVDNLQPGTLYMFKLYTKNEVGLSVASSFVAGCKTKAKMSTAPTSLQINNVTSRSFQTSWGKPVNLHSEENYGYVVQIKDGDRCVKEIIYKCSDCNTGSFKFSDLSGLCTTLESTEMSKTKQELEDTQSYTADLNPDINYTVTVTAINDAGRGYEANKTAKTSEEAPQKPYVVQVEVIGPTSINVTWDIGLPRPGQTEFTIRFIADSPAETKEYTMSGYNVRKYMAEDLEEFWLYRVTVTAATSVKAITSDETQKYTTLPAAPGKVSNFDIIKAPGGDYTKCEISWQAPGPLEKNSIIKSYSLEHFVSGSAPSFNNFTKDAAESYVYTQTLDVVPEESYTFSVYAVNEGDQKGANTTEQLKAPAGVPRNIEEELNIDIIAEDKVQNVEQTEFTITIVREFFEEETYGAIRATGLVACANGCEFTGIKTLDDFNRMDNWKTAKGKGFALYRITPPTWLTDLDAKQADNAGRRKRAVTEIQYTVGDDDCTSVPENEYCNGPLNPGIGYSLKAVSCTNGGCLLSQKQGPFVTKAVPDEPDNTPMIIGIVVAVVVLVVIGAVVGFIMIRKRRGPGKMKPASDSDDDEFSPVDPAISKIKRKRPFLLSDIEDYVNNMHKDSNLLFSSEYEDLKTLSPKHPCDAADREENRMRNRYINIIPFDHTRVKLSTNGEDDPCDYINANYLPGYTSPREYIGCQGPIPGTIDDFWRMTWEQNVSVIVMLTLCKEGQKIKCEQYWPEDVAEPKQYGDVIVEMTSYSNIRTYDYRLFKITNGNQTRVIKHFHFLSWLDFQANVHHDIILDFILQVRQHVQPPDTSGPMIVHCSAGVGRTGTYIALDHLMQFINEHDFDVQVDIFDMVLNLRENRQHMVQTEQQYVFIHDCVKEILERKRRNMENIYENEAFWKKRTAQDENIYQNEQQNLYANVAASGHEQNTEL